MHYFPARVLVLFVGLISWISVFAETQKFELQAIDRVWAGHDAPFGLAVSDDLIVVAYYNSERQLSIASKPLQWDGWRIHRLDSWLGWDSHNSLSVAFDAAGHIHLSGNMHNDPLLYFKTEVAGDIRSFRRIKTMVTADKERAVTYPHFFKNKTGNLYFSYRDGGSGSGNNIYNRYDEKRERWHKLIDSALVDGEGERNAYIVGPILGPDGYFHITWVWRDSPDASTNHDLSYARSQDLVHWQNSSGKNLALPITIEIGEVVDPIAIKQGLINNNTLIGFDHKQRVLLAYHKYDANGQTQAYIARREAEVWKHYQVSQWQDFRWQFGGWGTLNFRLQLLAPYLNESGALVLPYIKDGSSEELLLNADNLALETMQLRQTVANSLKQHIALPGNMQLNTIEHESGLVVAWPSLPSNRDRARTEIPSPSVFYLAVPTPP